MKQSTYLITVNKDKRQEVLNSKTALIRDWNMGWFEVPSIFKDEFEKKFGYVGVKSGVCNKDITKEDIDHINYLHWHKGAIEC